MNSFFDLHYKAPKWFLDKQQQGKSVDDRGNARRSFLKAAAGATSILAAPWLTLAANEKKRFIEVKTDPWLTLNSVLNHLLPASKTGPSAKEINALNYLYNVVHQQPTSDAEVAFIKNGVTWLNDYSKSQLKRPFVELNDENKEAMLRAVSRSRAGDNWINTLLGYIIEAMLSPPSYGGNPNGIGWQWLDHQPGFPLPKSGQRFYELPLTASSSQNKESRNKYVAQNKSSVIMMQQQKGLS